MTVYIDIVLLENICMNYIILFATGLITKAKINQIKILLSSILGSIYVIISFFLPIDISSNMILKILLSIAMIYIAFTPNVIKKCISEVIIFYLTSFAFGGCAIFLLYYIKPQNILMKNGIYIGSYPVKIAILGGILGFIIINIAFKIIKGKMATEVIYINLIIYINDKKAKAKAMLDTGNFLKDPISKMPVIIVDKSVLKNIITESEINEIMNILINKEVKIKKEILNKVRLIPFSSLGKQDGMLIGLKPDKVSIEIDNDYKEEKNVIIGIYEKKLDGSGRYNAILGLDLIKNTESKM